MRHDIDNESFMTGIRSQLENIFNSARRENKAELL